MGFCRKNAVKVGLVVGWLGVMGLLVPLPVGAFFTTPGVSLTGISLAVAGDWEGDETAPVSEIGALAVYHNQRSFSVGYSFSDDMSGVRQVEIFYRYNHEFEWRSWRVIEGAELTGTFVFEALRGEGFYELKSRATDKAGNMEEEKLSAEAVTTVDTKSPLTSLVFDWPIVVHNDRVLNGSFEDGLNGWEGEGEVEVIEGKARLRDSSSIKQQVDLTGLDKAYLIFDYRLETNDWASSGFFQTLIDNKEVAHDGWDDPELRELSLAWKKILYPLGDYLGKKIDLEFKLTQPETGYETSAFVDEIKVCAAVPQVATTAKIGLESNDASGSANSTLFFQVDDLPPVVYGVTPVSLPTPGVYRLSYYAVDEAGNREATKSAVVESKEEVDWGVVLNEIAPNESWVSLFNNSAQAVKVEGWKVINAKGQVRIIEGNTLRVEGVFLDNQKEAVYLYDQQNKLIDSFSYDLPQALPAGKSFKRDPDGVGGWKDPPVEPEVRFYWVDKNRVGWVINNLENYQKIDYEIGYTVNSLEEGIRGEVRLAGQKEIRRENFVLGTCSTGGTCVYHQGVKNLRLKIRLWGENEKEVSRSLD